MPLLDPTDRQAMLQDAGVSVATVPPGAASTFGLFERAEIAVSTEGNFAVPVWRTTLTVDADDAVLVAVKRNSRLTVDGAPYQVESVGPRLSSGFRTLELRDA